MCTTTICCRVEQAGTPHEVYEQPANEFVMGFVGPVSRFGEDWVRPHDVALSADRGPDAAEALVERVARLGFEVRVNLKLADGTPLAVQLIRHQAEDLELSEGQILYVRPQRSIRFAERT